MVKVISIAIGSIAAIFCLIKLLAVLFMVLLIAGAATLVFLAIRIVWRNRERILWCRK